MHTHSAAGHHAVTATAPVIRLLLVDDHGIVREGLRALLDEDAEFVIVGEASNGDEACEAVRRLTPDIVLMDLKMPGMAASDAIRVIRASSPDVKVIALTSYAEDGQVREIIAAGAQGYILKEVTKADFLDGPAHGCRRADLAASARAALAGRAAAQSTGRSDCLAHPARTQRARADCARHEQSPDRR